MTIYSDLADTAHELLTEYGDNVTVTRPTGTVDPVTRVRSATTQVQVLKGRLEAQGSLILNLERTYKFVALLAAKDAEFEPEAGHTITAPEGTFTVKEAAAIQGQGSAIVYELGLA